MVDVNHSNENINDYQEDRPPSEQLVELHIYLVPKDKWLEKRKLAKNQAVDHTISVGFVRVLPHTHLSELKAELHKQLGIDSVPQNYVFLRSVGRNFTQVRPRQEMEMKVKNFMPPYATDPEIYLKEGPYTGPNTWSQGEDSGLEESLADSNSQRSHDRATPESLTDDQLILPKVADLLNLGRESETPDDLDEHRSSETPPTAMAIPMADDEEDLTTGLTRGGRSFAGGIPDIEKLPMKSLENGERLRRSRYRKDPPQQQPLLDFNELPKDVRTVDLPKNRGGSLNRTKGRLPSKERGGTQMPTWTETRTTRLRRSKALGETKPINKPFFNRHQSRKTEKKTKIDKSSINHNIENNATKKEDNAVNANFDAEDEAEDDCGKILMERIRANSRSLRARLSSHSRRHVADTGTRTRFGTDSIDTRYKTDYNGVYTMHSRRNRAAGAKLKDGKSEENVQIESTTVQVVDGEGTTYNIDDDIGVVNKDLDQAREEDNSEIVHLHTLSAQGVDGRNPEDQTEEIAVDEGHYQESAEQENDDANHVEMHEEPVQHAVGPPEELNKGENLKPEDSSTPENGMPDVIPEETSSEEHEQEAQEQHEQANEGEKGEQEQEEIHDTSENPVKELREGEHTVNRNQNITIEVEVKELNNDSDDVNDKTTDDAILNSQSQPDLLTLGDSMEFDSYPVYSEQNLPYTSSVEFPVPLSGRKPSKSIMGKSGKNRRSSVVKPERSHYSRGIYLRKMEHRERSGTNMRRVKSDGNGLADAVDSTEEVADIVEPRGLGQTRRGGMGSFEKWNTTSSTGDLRELPWEHVSEKERLLMILDGIRSETRAREKHREELLRRIKHLQNRAHQRREQGEEHTNRGDQNLNQNRCLRSLPEFARRADSAAVREMWRKRYLEAKKITPRLEEECSRLRQELEKLHRELLAKVQAGVWALLTISGKTEKPSNKLSYKIMIARLLQEIEDLSRRVEGTRLKLHTEVKLRAMAEKDVRNLREELLKKKIQVTLTRNQEQAAMGNGIRQQYFISAV